MLDRARAKFNVAAAEVADNDLWQKAVLGFAIVGNERRFVGEAVDTMIFYPIAFYGTWTNELLLAVMLNNYLLKTGWEVVMTPVTYKVVAFLKRAEHEDYYDRGTDFNPFTIKV